MEGLLSTGPTPSSLRVRRKITIPHKPGLLGQILLFKFSLSVLPIAAPIPGSVYHEDVQVCLRGGGALVSTFEI